MIRAQVFKSLAGAQKRAAVETAHSKHTDYAVAWCNEHGQPLPPGFSNERGKSYTWRLQLTRRNKG